MLRVRFTEDPRIPGIAEHLAHTQDGESSIRLIYQATSLDDLLIKLVPDARSNHA